MKGIRWGVGNGDSINVLSDNWIPGLPPGTFKILEELPADTKVSFFLNNEANAWDAEKVCTFFTAEMAAVVLRIPVSRHGGVDFLSWPADKFGTYSVRLAYNMTRTGVFFAMRGAKARGDSSDLGANEKFWKAIWAINCPEKMKFVIWRMVHDCLTTGAQLRKRCIPAEDCCVFCGRSDDVEHVFLFCPFARSIWDAVKAEMQFKLSLKSFSKMRLWVFAFLERASHIQATSFAVTCWQIWEARNDARNGRGCLQPSRLANNILVYVDSIVKFCSKPSPTKRCVSPPKSRWSPPPVGTSCVNVDAAVFQSENLVGWGAVVRDHCGMVQFAGHGTMQGSLGPEAAEALAVRQAMEITRENGIQKIVLASDCLSLILKIQAPLPDRSEVGSLVGDIKRLSLSFLSCSFVHVGRLCNIAAHKLARSKEPSVCKLYFDVVPDFIRDELSCDVL
jgi:hypothetical protein